MDDAHDGSYAREPQLDDLVRLARALNAHHVRYVLIGGFAVIAHGGARTTKDIVLLIDAGPANVARVREALQIGDVIGVAILVPAGPRDEGHGTPLSAARPRWPWPRTWDEEAPANGNLV